MFTLKAAREMRGLTQRGLAERASDYLGKPVDEDTISNLERGWKNASPQMLHALALALAASPLEVRPAGGVFPDRPGLTSATAV